MSLTFPNIAVVQQAPQQQAAPPDQNTRTIAVLGTFPQGNPIALVGADQAINVFGDPANPAYSGFTGPKTMDMVVRQTGIANRAYNLNVIGVRVGDSPATAQLADNASGHPFTVTGIGQYAGSRGNGLQVVVNSPQLLVQRVQYGNATQNEVQQLTIYATGGSPTYAFTLTAVNASGASGTTASITAGTASAIQTALNAASPLLGASAVTVTATTPPQAYPNALSFLITFTGTSYANKPQTLITTGGTVTTGTGTIPVQSILVNDSSTGTAVTRQQVTAGQHDLSSNTTIAAALNTSNPPAAPSSLVQITGASPTGALPITQTVTLSGGSDGLGATTTDASIATRLAQVASGALGDVNFIVAGFDAAAITPAIETFIAAAAANNIFVQAFLGPQAGTSVSSLLAGYQVANSDRVVYVAHDTLGGSNPTNRALLTGVPGYQVAAGLCGLKAIQSAEFNLYNASLAGVGSTPPINSATGAYLTPTDNLNLLNAGFTVLAYNPQVGRVTVQRLINTAQQTDNYGQPNRFVDVSERDCFDMIARGLIATVRPFLGTPAASPQQVVSTFTNLAVQYMASTQGRYHNGATVTVNYNNVTNVVTLNVGYLDRPPLNTIVINLSPVAALPASSTLAA